MRGQLSLEALISFAALLSAFSVLIFAAQNLGERAGFSIAESSERYAVSYAALVLDEAAGSMRYSSYPILNSSRFKITGEKISSKSRPEAEERLFYDATKGTDVYGGTAGYEPI